MLGKYLLLQLLFLVLSGLLVASHTALSEANFSKIKDAADSGDKKAQKLQRLAEKQDKSLVALESASLIIYLFGSALLAFCFSRPFGQWLSGVFGFSVHTVVAIVLITLVFSLLLGSVGRAVPKKPAEKHADSFLSALRCFIIAVTFALAPFAAAVRGISSVCLRLCGIDPNAQDEAVSEEDIVMMLDAGAEDGTLNNDDIEYIKNVFELDHLTAADVMTPRNSIELIADDAAEDEILALIDESGYSRIPIYSGTVDNITGILLVRDYLIKRHNSGFTLRDATFQPTFVPETVHLDALFKDMQTDHSHMVIVVDEYGGTAGLVTMEDILEELVGEIWDEQDEETVNFEKLSDDTYKISSATPIDEFFEFFSLDDDEDIESTTVNGWVTEHCGKIPEEGFTFDYKNLSVTVTKADDLRSEEITVRVNPSSEPDEE